jgi:hypothetical protein
MPTQPINQEARNELKYEWVAEYSDGTNLKQFDEESNTEYNFGDIDQERLVELKLVHKEKDITYSVNVQNGLFSINGVVTREVEGKPLGIEVTSQVKPIMFRRVKRQINALDPSQSRVVIMYFLGWKELIDGNYQEFGIQIFENGTFALPPDDGFHAL